MNVYGVVFQDRGKVYYFNGQNLKIPLRVTVIVDTERGLQFGKVVSKMSQNDVNLDKESLKNIIRIATKKDYEEYLKNLKDAKEALNHAKEFSSELGLQMNFIDAAVNDGKFFIGDKEFYDSRLEGVKEVVIGIRAEKMSSGNTPVMAKTDIVEMSGGERTVYFSLNNCKCTAKFPLEYNFKDSVELRLSTDNMYFFNKSNGERIV